jgi:hypothetical protein
MELEEKYISEEVCNGHKEVVDERFARDKERLNNLEETQRQLSSLSVQFGEMIKNQSQQIIGLSSDSKEMMACNIKLTELVAAHSKQIENHEQRLDTIEKKPSTWLDRIIGWILAAFISGCVAIVVAKVFA